MTDRDEWNFDIPVRLSRARRYDELNRRFVPKRPPGMSIAEFMARAGHAMVRDHRRRMLALAFAKFGIDPRAPDANNRLLVALLREIFPAFRDDDAPTAGRPRTITDAQVRRIQRAVEAGRSVRSECLKLAKGDGRKASALAAAYRRATK